MFFPFGEKRRANVWGWSPVASSESRMDPKTQATPRREHQLCLCLTTGRVAATSYPTGRNVSPPLPACGHQGPLQPGPGQDPAQKPPPGQSLKLRIREERRWVLAVSSRTSVWAWPWAHPRRVSSLQDTLLLQARHPTQTSLQGPGACRRPGFCSLYPTDSTS